MEFMIWVLITTTMCFIGWKLSEDEILVLLISMVFGGFGGMIYCAMGQSFMVDPTITQIPIDNIQIVENGYVIEYGDTKKFLNKNEIEVEISDKNVLVENKYEYSKVENQFPYNVTPTNPDGVEYKLLIKSEK